MKTARARPSPGTCSRNSSRRFPTTGWSSTRSPPRRSRRPSPTRASSTRPWSTRTRPGGCSTGCTATKSRRCCGRRSCPGCQLAGSSRWPPAWSSTGSGSGSPSGPPSTGTSRPSSPPLPATTRTTPAARTARAHVRSARHWSPWTDGALPRAATSTRPANCAAATSCTLTGPLRRHSPAGCRTPPFRSVRSSASPTSGPRTHRSARPPSSRRRRGSSAFPPSKRCRWRSGCTRTATSPICGPTRQRCRRPRSTPPAGRPATFTASPTSPTPRACTPAR